MSRVVRSREAPFLVPALVGTFACLVVGVAVPAALHKEPWESQTVLVRQWLAAGIVCGLVMSATAMLAAVRSSARLRLPGWVRWVSIGFVVVFTLCATSGAIAALWLPGRPLAVPLGVFETLLVLRLAGRRLSIPEVVAVAVASLAGWVASLGLPFTPQGDWLLGLTFESALAPIVFVGSVLLAACELGAGASSPGTGPRRGRIFIAAGVAIVFAMLSLDTRGLAADWVPYHRSFWVGPADFVREGGWLLWAAPSQYGFASALSLAVWPAASTWQGLYEQTAIATTLDACVVFAMLRDRRSGIANVLFSAALAGAAFFGPLAARAPFGWRLYPQAGLRFTWIVMLLGAIFAIHRATSRRRTAAFALGHGLWGLSLLWSFETGVFASVIWVPFVTLWAALETPAAVRAGRAVRPAACAVALFALVPAACAAGVQLFYELRLGHAPDWRAFVEFSAAYAKDESLFQPFDLHGPGALPIVVLAVLAAVGCEAVRRAPAVVPGVAAACLAAWIATSYYVGEAFDTHVNIVSAVYVTAFALVLALGRSSGSRIVGASAQAAILPLCVLLISSWLGAPDAVAGALRSQVRDRWSAVAAMPEAPPEVLGILRLAHAEPDDRVVLPVSVGAIKLEIGLVSPFAPGATGAKRQLRSWLPISPEGPYNEFYTLDWTRRLTYLERFRSEIGGGWLIAYRERADCARYGATEIARTRRRQTNLDIVRCR